MTMTMKIDLTTEAVTLRPSDSADPCTSMPSTPAMTPMVAAMNGALISPTAKVSMAMALCRRVTNTIGVMPA